MIDIEEFTSGKNWAFVRNINDGFIVSSSSLPDGTFQVMAADGEIGSDCIYVEGAENAYAAVIAGLARYVADHVGRNPKDRDGAFRSEHFVDLAVERGGFRPGTYTPYGVMKRVACAFVSEAMPGAMLLAAAPYYADDRGAETAFVQVELKGGDWVPSSGLAPQLVEAVEQSYCQWAKDALAHKGYMRTPASMI